MICSSVSDGCNCEVVMGRYVDSSIHRVNIDIDTYLSYCIVSFNIENFDIYN